MKLAVVGLGQMGLPVAAALAGAGHEVLAWDTDPARIAEAVRHGARDAGMGAAALAAPLVVTLLPNDAALLALCEGAGGLLARLPAGGVHLCLGTLGVATSQQLAAAHARATQAFVACPVFGRPDEAWQRDLTAVFGASPAMPAEAAAQARTVVACVAPRIHAVASPAAACAVKLAGNQMIASAVATLTECFALVQAHGVAAAQLHEVVTGKLFRGPVYEGVGRMLAGVVPPPSPPGFTLRLGLKDVALRAGAAQAAGVRMPVADAVQDCLARAVAAGHGHRDWAELPHCLPDAPRADPT